MTDTPHELWDISEWRWATHLDTGARLVAVGLHYHLDGPAVPIVFDTVAAVFTRTPECYGCRTPIHPIDLCEHDQAVIADEILNEERIVGPGRDG